MHEDLHWREPWRGHLGRDRRGVRIEMSLRSYNGQAFACWMAYLGFRQEVVSERSELLMLVHSKDVGLQAEAHTRNIHVSVPSHPITDMRGRLTNSPAFLVPIKFAIGKVSTCRPSLVIRASSQHPTLRSGRRSPCGYDASWKRRLSYRHTVAIAAVLPEPGP